MPEIIQCFPSLFPVWEDPLSCELRQVLCTCVARVIEQIEWRSTEFILQVIAWAGMEIFRGYEQGLEEFSFTFSPLTQVGNLAAVSTENARTALYVVEDTVDSASSIPVCSHVSIGAFSHEEFDNYDDDLGRQVGEAPRTLS